MNPVAQEAIATMKELGYPDHVIQGFLMNYQDESGLNPNIVEAEANVHGTRGKGLYQLTGARRTAYEERYGDDWSPRNQILFQDWELNNTEKRARDAIFAAKNPGEAGAAIVDKFLRPAEEHRINRMSKYTGNPPPIADYSGVPPMEGQTQEAGVPAVPEEQTMAGYASTKLGEYAINLLLGSPSPMAPLPPPPSMPPPPQIVRRTAGVKFNRAGKEVQT
jgi:hypothetical protein